jgi:hypothetical protein
MAPLRVPPPGMCFYHPNLPAVYICSRCGRPICRDCSKEYMGLILCPQCYLGVVPPAYPAAVAPAVAPAAPPVYPPVPYPPPPPKAVWGFILSLIAGLLFIIQGAYWASGHNLVHGLSSVTWCNWVPKLMNDYFMWLVPLWEWAVPPSGLPTATGGFAQIFFLVIGLVLGIATLLCAFMIYLGGYETTAGIFALVLSLIALGILGGGFYVGTALGVIGGVLAALRK